MTYARRCKDCDINYPSDPGYSSCRVCDKPTAHLVRDVDADWQAKVDALLETAQFEVEDSIVRWRYQELLKAGFDPLPALGLAVNRQIDLRLVTDRLIARGCTHELAYQIVS